MTKEQQQLHKAYIEALDKLVTIGDARVAGSIRGSLSTSEALKLEVQYARARIDRDSAFKAWQQLLERSE